MNNREIFKETLLLFLSWRLILILISSVGIISSNWQNYLGDYWLRWGYWDGVHFLSIAQNGYTSARTVFFPLFPLLIKSLHLFGVPYFWSGIFLANLFSLLAIFFFYKLLLLDYSLLTSRKIIFSLLAFPTSFYLGAVYSESLFLFLTISAFYWARLKKWKLAALLASLSAVSRFIGVVVILSLFTEYFLSSNQFNLISYFKNHLLLRFLGYFISLEVFLSIFIKWALDKLNYLTRGFLVTLQLYIEVITLLLLAITLPLLLRKFKNPFSSLAPLWWLLLSFMSFFFYLMFLYLKFHNPFIFIAHESLWGRHLSPPWDVIIDYSFYFFQTTIKHSGINQLIIDYLFTIFGLLAFIICALNLRISYVTYLGLSLIIPLLTGSLLSMPRFTLVMFPIMIIIGSIKSLPIYLLCLTFSLAMLGIFLSLFINYYWVS